MEHQDNNPRRNKIKQDSKELVEALKFYDKINTKETNMYNKVILLGNLAREPELKYLPSGSAICTTSIATNRKWKDQSGQQKEEVCFVDLTFFGKTGEIVSQYLCKGSRLLVEGRLKLDQWTDQSGGKRSKHSVTVDNLQMLDSKPNNSESSYSQPQTKTTPPVKTMPASEQGALPQNNLEDDDEIPF